MPRQYIRRTHCMRGHAFTEENTYLSSSRGRVTRRCRQCHLDDYHNLTRDAKKEKGRRTSILNTGRNPVDYERQLHLGSCALCGKKDAGRSLCSDHDHLCCPDGRSCGKCTRDFLCHKCNKALGLFGDSPDRLRDAASYIERWRKQHERNRFAELVQGTSNSG